MKDQATPPCLIENERINKEKHITVTLESLL